MVSSVLMCVFFVLRILIIQRKLPTKFFNFMILLIVLRIIFPLEILERTQVFHINKILPTIVGIFLVTLFKINIPAYHIHLAINFFHIFILLFAMISIMKLLVMTTNYYKLYRVTNQISPTKNEKILFVLKKLAIENTNTVRIITSDFIDSPMEFGFFKQTILLPTNEYKDEELYCILSHELYHFQNKSNWYKLLINILNSIFWWNPIVLIFNKHAATMLEIQCDAFVTNQLNDSSKAVYLSCLLNERTHNNKSSQLSTISFSGQDKKALYKRFKFITSKQKSSKITNFIAILMLFCMFFLSYTFIIQPYFEIPESELDFPVFTKDNSYIVIENDGYIVYYEDEPLIILNSLTETFSDLPIICDN